MKLVWMWNRLKAMSPSEVAWRTTSVVQSKLEYCGLMRARPSISDDRVVTWPGFDWCPQVMPDPYLHAAENLLQGRFRVFSIHSAELGFPPNWNCDPKSGVVAPMEFGKSIDYRRSALVGDIKYLWEPNRHLELVVLAQAWALSRNTKYLDAIRVLVESWLVQCPYPYGVNWTSSLELGIRLVNWAFAWQIVGPDNERLFGGLDGHQFRRRWLESIYQHCHFVKGHLSRHSSANNHLLGELFGLIIAAETWPLNSDIAEWGDEARVEFCQQALLQNAADGTNREQAIWYQHEVADMMLIAGLISRRCGRPFDPPFWQRLEALLDCLASVMDVGGNVPALGDSDDAVMVRLTQDSEFDAYRSLLASGAVLFERADLASKAQVFDSKNIWLFGDQGRAIFEGLLRRQAQYKPKTAFVDGGLFVIGSGFETSDEVRLIADAGPLGYLGIAAHGHADALSLLLSVGGKPILVDPGTFAYHTEKVWRNYFRGTAAHNTIRVDGVDQSVSGGNFLWTSHAVSMLERFSVNEGHTSWTGSHNGYKRLRDPVLHRRLVEYRSESRCFRVRDEIEALKEHDIEMFWHCSPNATVEVSRNIVLISDGRTVVQMTLPEKMSVVASRGALDPPLGWYSPCFDSRVETTTVVGRLSTKGAEALETMIEILSIGN